MLAFGAQATKMYSNKRIQSLISWLCKEKPFFSLIFTSSNHDPFEIPNGTIKPFDYTASQLAQYDDKERSRHKAIQYADFALGEFINTAKTQSYWQNTVFLIVADHDARVLGQHLVPVNNFHIPAIILNSEFDNQNYKAIASHIDLARFNTKCHNWPGINAVCG